MPNNRSDAALRERLEIAGKATKGPWIKKCRDFQGEDGFGWESKPTVEAEDKTICLFYDRDARADYVDNDEDDAAHIAASSPDVVQADIEEILRLRQEVARLDKEADWFIEYIWNKDIFRCPMPEGYKCEHKLKHICCLDSEETEIRGRCWKEAARKAVEEEENV